MKKLDVIKFNSISYLLKFEPIMLLSPPLSAPRPGNCYIYMLALYLDMYVTVYMYI